VALFTTWGEPRRSKISPRILVEASIGFRRNFAISPKKSVEQGIGIPVLRRAFVVQTQLVQN